VRNGHTQLLMALAKLASIVFILVCQNLFYKTSSIPKLLSWHIPLFDITIMLFGCFMGLLMVFIDFNFFWIEYDKWGHFIMSLVGPFTFHKNSQFDLNCTGLQMSPKCRNVLGPWTLCRNPSFVLATKAKGLQGCRPRGRKPRIKAKALQGCGPRGSQGVTSHTPGSVRKSVRKCDGVTTPL
jgi:hypothetical protein